jgi:hypothetical protein
MKKFTMIGMGMVLFSIILLYASSQQFESNLSNSTLQSAMLTPHKSLAIPFYITNSTVLGSFYYANSSNTSYYLVSSQAFSHISPYLNSSTLLNRSAQYEGNGLYEIIYRNSSGVFPDQIGSALKPPNYYYNGTAIFSNGTYYDIFQDNGNTSVLVYYSTVQKLQLSVNNSILGSTVFGLFAALMFLAGIALIGYSILIRKEELPKAAIDGKNIDALYAKYDRKKAPRKPRKTPRKKAKQK